MPYLRGTHRSGARATTDVLRQKLSHLQTRKRNYVKVAVAIAAVKSPCWEIGRPTAEPGTIVGNCRTIAKNFVLFEFCPRVRFRYLFFIVILVNQVLKKNILITLIRRESEMETSFTRNVNLLYKK